MVLSSMNLTILFATSSSFTRAHLKIHVEENCLVKHNNMKYMIDFDRIDHSTYPMRVPAWPVAFVTVKSDRSWSAGEEMGVYWGQ